MQGLNLLRLFKNMLSSSLPSVHIKKISYMYLNHIRGCNCCISRNCASNLFMERSACGSANLVLMAVPETWCLIVLSSSKKLFFSTELSVGIHFLSCLSNTSLKALTPDSSGMMGLNPTKSTVTKIALSGIVLRFLVLFMKSLGSLKMHSTV